MKLFETPKHPPVEITWNVINVATGKQVNQEPLTEDAARVLMRKLQESDANMPKEQLRLMSNRATLMG